MKNDFSATTYRPEHKVVTYAELLPRGTNSYKINLHSHSTGSDGYFSPSELKELYVSNGYSALAFTDHRTCVSHNELTDENFIALWQRLYII